MMPPLVISFDPARIDFRATAETLKASYWAAKRTDAINKRAFANSLCAVALLEDVQVGFARATTDYSVFAYLSDVIVWPQHRGKGIGRRLIGALLDHPELATVSHWSLATTDAHALYEKFGFQPSSDGRYMRLDRETTS